MKAMSGFAESFREARGMSVSVEAKHLAFDHVIGSIRDEPRFPEQVFRGRWTAFLFFDSDF
jgi:hypothetical protein